MRYSEPDMANYTWICAERDTHEPINTLAEMRRAGGYETSLGLFFNGVAIGTGSYSHVNWRKKWIATESVSLNKKYRRKGHGIPLYRALIAQAILMGATRLYSSDALNKFSRRMWREKLPKAGFNVQSESMCEKPCRHCRHGRYYIDLTSL